MTTPAGLLALFTLARDGDGIRREHCLGLVEKALLIRPDHPGLKGTKAALLVLLSGDSRSVVVCSRFRRVAMKLARDAVKSGPDRDLAHLVNGLAWAQIADGPEADAIALMHLDGVTQRDTGAGAMPPDDLLPAWVALSVIHQAAGRVGDARRAFMVARDLDRDRAALDYERLNARRGIGVGTATP